MQKCNQALVGLKTELGGDSQVGFNLMLGEDGTVQCGWYQLKALMLSGAVSTEPGVSNVDIAEVNNKFSRFLKIKNVIQK